MTRHERARAELAALMAGERDAHLLAGSNLPAGSNRPGPRANLELLDAVGDVLARGEALRLVALRARAG